MANSLLIEKQTGGYFKFVLNGDTANAVTSIQNDLLAVGNQLHFKTGNGANIIKEQFIYPEDVTIVSGGTFTFTTVAQVWDKLIDIDYFAWLGSGGGSGVYIDRFDDLVDTFKYTGNAGKTVVVDNSELKLVPVTLYNKRLFTELDDTPDSLVPNKMVVVNSTGNALILQDQPEAPESLLNSVGYFDYNDLITQTTPLTAVTNTPLKLTNDSEGANTSTDQNPYGVSYVWDSTTNQFNFSELSVGDTIDVRVHVQVTTTTSNQKVDIKAKFGIGSVAEFTNSIFETTFKSSGLHEISFVAPFYMGSTYITDYPAELYLTTDASATVQVDGWYIRIIRKDINIITVDYAVPDATTLVKGIVRLGGDLAGTANSPTVPELANKVPTSRIIGTTSPLLGGGALTSDLALSIQQANSTQPGYLSASDWSTFYNKANDNAVVHLTGDETITGRKTFNSSTDIGIRSNNSGSGYGIYSENSSTGTGYYVANNGQGKAFLVANALSSFGNMYEGSYNGTSNFVVNYLGEITASKFIKSGGTSSQFLKANGDLDSNTYALDSAVVKLTGDQTITGTKTFGSIVASTLKVLTFGAGMVYSDSVGSLGTAIGTANTLTYWSSTSMIGSLSTSTYPSLTEISYVKGVTSAIQTQLDAKQNTLTNPVTASTFTANYHAKFTGSGYAIGNSIIWDNGTNVGIGTTSPNYSSSGRTVVDINGTSQSMLALSVGGVGKSFLFYTGTDLLVSNESNGAIKFNTNGSEKAIITSSGQVQISSPISDALKLTNTNSGAYNGVLIQNDASNQVVLGMGGSTVGGTNQNRGYSGTVSNIDYYLMTNNSPRLLITSGGNVGIGTTSPSNLLTIRGNGNNMVSIQYNSDGGASGLGFLNSSGTELFSIGGGRYQRQDELAISRQGTSVIYINNSNNVGIGTTSPSAKLHISNSGAAGLELSPTGGASGATYIQAYNRSTSSPSALDVYASQIAFQTSDVERMRITSGGDVFIGATSAANVEKLGVTYNSQDRLGFVLNDTYTGAGGAQIAIQFRRNGSAIGSITTTTTTTSYNINSDYRLKEDFRYYSGLDLISKIKTYDYKWKISEDRMYGVKAHELQEVIPYAVTGEKDAEQMQSVDYSKLVPILVQAIQELKAEIEILKNK